MGGLPASRGTTAWSNSRRSTPSDRLLLARLDRGVQLYPLVCSDALDHSDWLRGQPHVRFITGELLVHSFFVGPPLIPPPELFDGYVFVSFCPWTLFPGSNVPQECIQHPLSPLTPYFAADLALRSLYLPPRCLRGSVPKFIPPRRLFIGIHRWA